MPSATQLIKRDHRKVESLFDRFDKSKNANAKKKVCEQVIQELEVHAKLEEEIFYPAVRKHIGEEEMLQEAKQEHQEAKNIIAELKKGGMEDDELESKFAELVEGVKHHVEEEESEMLPKVEESEMDLEEYGQEMAERKKELLNQSGKQTGKSRSSAKSRGTSKSQGSKGRTSKKKKSTGRKAKSGGGRGRSGRAA